MALRAFASLEWANSCFLKEDTDSEWAAAPQHIFSRLKMALLQLLHDLLIGHFGDPGPWPSDMNFWKILSAGLSPVLRSLTGLPATDSCATSLVVAFLHRAVHDEVTGPFRLTADFKHMKEIWSLFGTCTADCSTATLSFDKCDTF